MSTVENSSMHSLGIWKRRFSFRVCWMLTTGCGECSLAGCMRVGISGTVLICLFLIMGFCLCGSKCSWHPSHSAPLPRHWAGINSGHLCIFLLGSHPIQPSRRVWKKKNKSDPTTNMAAVPSKWGPLSLEAVTKVLEEGLLRVGVESLLPEGRVLERKVRVDIGTVDVLR